MSEAVESALVVILGFTFLFTGLFIAGVYVMFLEWLTNRIIRFCRGGLTVTRLAVRPHDHR